ncbi:MAG: hypothetical protein NTW36_10780 [Planctomycetia bacterium]|jgi:hypothetical protein|nr:hypothetical protein [Planctomycetia bacterium]
MFLTFVAIGCGLTASASKCEELGYGDSTSRTAHNHFDAWNPLAEEMSFFRDFTTPLFVVLGLIATVGLVVALMWGSHAWDERRQMRRLGRGPVPITRSLRK